MALNSELDDLLDDLGVDDAAPPKRGAAGAPAASSSSSGSPLNRWRVKTKGLIQKSRQRRGIVDSDDEDSSPLGRRSRAAKKDGGDVKSVLGSGFSIRKLAGWSSPSRTNKSDLRSVTDIIDSVICSTRAELGTEAIMKAVSQELGQMFNANTWTEWFNIKIEEAYERRSSPKAARDQERSSGIQRSSARAIPARRRLGGNGYDDSDESEDDSDDDTPVRSRRGSPNSGIGRKSPGGGAGGGSNKGSPRRQLVDDESDNESQDLASAPFSEFVIGTFCTVLPTADAASVSRDVRKLRKIKTQIWGGMQEKYGERTGRVIGRNEDEELVKLQFPQADLWFVYEALDITEDQNLVRQARDALRRANAQTPPSSGTGKPSFGAAAQNLARRSMEKQMASNRRRQMQDDDDDDDDQEDPDADSDDDMRQHFQDTTEQVEEVTVTFEAGPLGMGFGWDGEFLEVFKFNADAAGNSGQAEASGSIVIGDLLVAVNDRPLSGLSKLEVINILKSTPRPMNCTFRGIPEQ